MGLFLKKQKVFISHNNIDGGVSAEVVLLKHILDKVNFLDNLMDVQQEIPGQYPETLNDKIRKSNSFIFLIPSNGDVSFLRNPDGWVYKEIYDALLKYDCMPNKSDRKSFQILPISFSNSFNNLPNDLPKDISEISKFHILHLNLNDKTEEIQKKVSRALHNKAHRSINWWGIVIVTILAVIYTFLGIRYINKLQEDRIVEERAAFIKTTIQDKIRSRIQPSYIIPYDERSPLEDSIYRFFELRDQFYYIVETLPIIKKTGIERNDGFTERTIMMVYNSFISSLTPIYELKLYSNRIITYGNEINAPNNKNQYNLIHRRLKQDDYNAIARQTNNVINIGMDLDTSLEKLRMQYQINYNELFKTSNAYVGHRNIKKSFNKAIKFTDNYEYWDYINREITKVEETAKLCNMILGHQ